MGGGGGAEAPSCPSPSAGPARRSLILRGNCSRGPAVFSNFYIFLLWRALSLAFTNSECTGSDFSRIQDGGRRTWLTRWGFCECCSLYSVLFVSVLRCENGLLFSNSLILKMKERLVDRRLFKNKQVSFFDGGLTTRPLWRYWWPVIHHWQTISSNTCNPQCRLWIARFTTSSLVIHSLLPVTKTTLDT